MTNEEIFALMDRFERSSLASMKVVRGDCSVELSRASASPAPAVTAAAAAPVSAPAQSVQEENSPCIRAPLVGTFYAAPSPDQPPFVRPGDRVEKGQAVCLIEAMKMMSEVTAPCACIIEEVLQENGALLSYDTPIFRYRAV